MKLFINQMDKSWPYSLSSYKITFLRLSVVFFFNIIVAETSLASNLPFNPLTMSEPDDLSSLKTLNLDGYFIFDDIHHAAKDFGNRYQHLPYAILRPNSVSDISKTVKHVFQMGTNSKLRVAARGHAHSLQGQAQAEQGIVIEMESLKKPLMQIYSGDKPYIDVSGGELWINILHETLKHGLAPKSWTDYLHLTVGGTLSNAGISGQAFRHGPQISNVLQMEIVTGKGEVLNCSEKENADLFHGVLGGLGQLGIITRARISLETAPRMVKWIRILYADFSTFAKDQEHLISSEKTFDYIEGFVIINRTGLLSNWRSSFSPEDPLKASKFISDGKTLYCLEMTKNFNPEDRNNMEQEIKQILSQLNYISSTLFISEVPYFDFLDRVHISEMNLRSKGLWDIPHPWLNLLIPSTKIHHFAREVFGKILKDSGNGPILIYPLNKTKWDNRTSAVTPDENVFYLVAFLTSALPSHANSLEQLLHQNEKVLEFCEAKEMGVKQYLPHYTVQEKWRRHFGLQWEVLVRRKMEYDPLAILAPGQKIFQKARNFL